MKKLLLLSLAILAAMPALLAQTPTVTLTQPQRTLPLNNDMTLQWSTTNMSPNTPGTLAYAPWGTSNYTVLGSGVGGTNLFQITTAGYYKFRVTCMGYADSTRVPIHFMHTPDPAIATILTDLSGKVYKPGEVDTIADESNFMSNRHEEYLIDDDNPTFVYDFSNDMFGGSVINGSTQYHLRRVTMPAYNCSACRYVIMNKFQGFGTTVAYDTSATFALNSKSISGRVYFDNNSNNVYDDGDIVVAYPQIVVTPNINGTLDSKADGSYTYYTNTPGSYTITVPLDACGQSLTSTPIIAVLDTGTQTLTGQDFRILLAQNNVYNAGVAMVSTSTPVFLPAVRLIKIVNYGSLPTPAGSFTFTYNPGEENYLADYPYYNNVPIAVTANTNTYSIPVIYPCENYIVRIPMQATVPFGTLLEETLTLNGYANDSDNSNNTITTLLPAIGSYDPNDKQVDKDTIYTPELPAIAPLNYMIRFQNTGNAPAYNINVTDTLSADFDLTTFRPISFSHACDVATVGNVVNFKFADIYLPDSTNNEPESHGYIIFSIKPKNILVAGDAIDNFVDIFFDYNLPVRTNTAVVHILNPTGINTVTQSNFSLYPNPATTMVQIGLKDNVSGKVQARLFTADGKQIQTSTHIVSNGNAFMFDVSSLANGVYYIGIKAIGAETMQKLVVVN